MYIAGSTKQENETCHNKWLDDVAIRLLCVFALDRFGDFVSDQVIMIIMSNVNNDNNNKKKMKY